MPRITLAAALVAATTFAPLPIVVAHAEGPAPMQAAGTAGEHVDQKAMEKAGTTKRAKEDKGHMKSKKKM